MDSMLCCACYRCLFHQHHVLCITWTALLLDRRCVHRHLTSLTAIARNNAPGSARRYGTLSASYSIAVICKSSRAYVAPLFSFPLIAAAWRRDACWPRRIAGMRRRVGYSSR